MPSRNKNHAETALLSCRARLADAIEQGENFDRLATRLTSVAAMEGEVYAWTVAEAVPVVEHATLKNAARLTATMAGLLTNPVYTDRWSGRENDARRAWLDGVAYVVQKVIMDGVER